MSIVKCPSVPRTPDRSDRTGLIRVRVVRRIRLDVHRVKSGSHTFLEDLLARRHRLSQNESIRAVNDVDVVATTRAYCSGYSGPVGSALRYLQ